MIPCDVNSINLPQYPFARIVNKDRNGDIMHHAYVLVRNKRCSYYGPTIWHGHEALYWH